MSASDLLKDWQDAARVRFVSRSNGQRTTDTVSRDDLIQLINAARDTSAAPQAAPAPQPSAPSGEPAAGQWALWACNQETGREHLVRMVAAADAAEDLAAMAAAGRDVWAIDPAGAKHLPAAPQAAHTAAAGLADHVPADTEAEAATDAKLGLVMLPPIRVDRATHAALQEAAKAQGVIVQAIVRDRLAPYAIPTAAHTAAAELARPMTERDQFDMARWHARLGELADAYYEAGRTNPARQRARADLMLHALECATGWRTRSALAAHTAAARAVPAPAPSDMEDPVMVPRGLIGAACSALDFGREAPKTLAELRRYTIGDRSGPAAAAPQAQAVRAPNVGVEPHSAAGKNCDDDQT